VINSHYHSDHTHGNPAFPEGTRVVATERTLWHLENSDMAHFAGAEHTLPNETFQSQSSLTVGNKHLTLLHPGRGHTDGDLVVLFEEENTIHMGDLHFNGHYPNIDLEAGGSVQEWPATIDRVLAELDFATVIPGHGPVTDIKGVRQFQTFIQQLGEVGKQAAEDGLTEEQLLATSALTEDAGYEPIKWLGISLGLDRPFVLRRAWEEATGNFELRE
jgi:cyclase